MITVYKYDNTLRILFSFYAIFYYHDYFCMLNIYTRFFLGGWQHWKNLYVNWHVSTSLTFPKDVSTAKNVALPHRSKVF